MRTCVMCQKNLTMWNVPSKSVRFLKDGYEICADCLQQARKLSPDIVLDKHDRSTLIQALDTAKDRIKRNNDRISNARYGTAEDYGVKNTLAELNQLLHEDEDLIGMIQIFDGVEARGGMFVTDRRIICITKGMSFNAQTTDFPYSKISSIDFNPGFFETKFAIHTSGNSMDFITHNQSLATQIINYVREKITTSTSPKESTNSGDLLGQLEKLAKLKEIGAITDDEFNAKKTEILKRI
jgi:hypothetical protein